MNNVGYGMSSDAYHATAPSDDGDGTQRCMQAALSSVDVSDVDYINAHATSTPLGDAVEVKAIAHVFGAHAYKVSISSTKGSIGHALGAAGL